MAGKELAKVRTTFVMRANEVLIKQLLDDLLVHCVMYDEEIDFILKNNITRADKARCLIDIVRKKGDEASRTMIALLQHRDPALYTTLGLSPGQPAEPAAEPQTEQEWSLTLIPTTKAFWREKQNDKRIYPAAKKSIMSRVALLITNIKFTDEKLNRDGADIDEQNMEKLLKALGYEVVKHTNLTGKEIDNAVIKFSKHPKLKETDSVFVVIMSHGKPGAVLGVKYKDEEPDEFPIDNIYKHLDTQKCPALLNKPKIVIIQACRGEKKGSVLVSDSAEAAVVCDNVQQPDLSLSAGEEDIVDDALQCAHKEKDFIALLSCNPDTVSYRNRFLGSFLITYIFEVVNTFAHKDDIEELFRKVMQRFEEDFPSATKNKMPTKDRCSLPKRFYLFPRLQAFQASETVMAGKELAKVRTTFVMRANEVLIKQLLDDLLVHCVMYDEEIDFILENNITRADKARCLIDIVRKKGDEASRTMIALLQHRDPALYTTLGLSPGQPAEPAAEPQTEQEWSLTLIPTTEAFWREKQNDKRIYPAAKKSIMSRVALLITNIKFTDEKLNRDGADIDEQNMEKLLKALGYEVVKHTNLTGKKIDNAVIKFSKHPKLKETDSVFVIIMSHGKLGAVLGVNHKKGQPDEFPINNIYKHLDTQKCPALLDKPKIIIIQACRGEKKGSVLVSDSAKAAVVCDDVQQPDLSLSAGVEDIEDEKDFMRFLSCTPDTVSYRNRFLGSFLITYIFEVLNTFAHKDDIEELFRKVMQRFEEDFSSVDKKQMPTKDRCSLPKCFYLFPGLQAFQASETVMAGKELAKVRTTFVMRANEVLIRQLLDDLLVHCVMYDEEIDFILGNNITRADKARCLIDIVRKKGDEASRTMIALLQHRDPALYTTLGLSPGRPAEPAAEPQTEQEWSPTLIPTTEAFWREKQNDKRIYLAAKNSIMSRVALLITNIKFTDEKLNRDGADIDEQNMEKLLKALRYEVVKHTNLTGKEIDNAVIKFSKHPKLRQTDSVFVIIMSHGKPGAVLGVKYKDEEPDEFPIDNIYKHLDTQKCPALLDKPKIIIIQACRREKKGSVLVSDSAKAAVVCDDVQQPDLSLSAGVEDIEEDALRHAHKEKDFIRFLSCTPDTVSYRNRFLGSFLIKFIFEVVNTFAHKEDIEELFRKVMQRFEEDFPSATKKLMPTKDRCSLPKRFYLFPGL
ncbi:uncharacterized protein [Thunnus thynnus]|uniref:uncharacterized protein n=1 Tax=Thunnus thynnus TaxID=8237 RepID=UPI003529731F